MMEGRTYYWNAAMQKSVWEKPDRTMEVKDSEGEGKDGSDFRPVVEVRPRKAKEEINVGDGQKMKKLLSSNKFTQSRSSA